MKAYSKALAVILLICLSFSMPMQGLTSTRAQISQIDEEPPSAPLAIFTVFSEIFSVFTSWTGYDYDSSGSTWQLNNSVTHTSDGSYSAFINDTASTGVDQLMYNTGIEVTPSGLSGLYNISFWVNTSSVDTIYIIGDDDGVPDAINSFVIATLPTAGSGWEYLWSGWFDPTSYPNPFYIGFSTASTNMIFVDDVTLQFNPNDGTPPTSNVNAMTYWYSSTPITVTATASDDSSGVKRVTLYYRYSNNNATWTVWTMFSMDAASPWQWAFNTPNGNGYYQLYTIAEDNAYNIESAPLSADEYVGVDTASPITNINAAPSYGGYISSLSSITLSATDTLSGVSGNYYRFWNGSWHPSPGTGVGKSNNFYVYSGAFTLIKPGTNYVEYYSVDTAGNQETTRNRTYYVDATPPAISNVIATPSIQNAGSYVNISARVEDAGANISSVNLEVTYPGCASTANFSMHYKPCYTFYRREIYTTVGVYNFTIYAVDNFGNSIRSPVFHFTILGENDAPTTSYSINPTSPNGDNGWYTTDVNVTLSATDPNNDSIAFTKYRLDGGAWVIYNGSFVISAEGSHILDFYSGDSLGNNETIKSVPIKIDKSGPTVILQRPLIGYLYFMDRQIWPLATGNTVILGRIVVRVVTNDMQSGIEKVKFYSNDVLQNVDTVAPYEWYWRGDMGFRYIYAVAYNRAGFVEQTDPVLVYIFSF